MCCLFFFLHKPFSTRHTRTIISKVLHWIKSALFFPKFHLGWVKVMCQKSPLQPLQPVTSLKLSNGTAPCTVHDYPRPPPPAVLAHVSLNDLGLTTLMSSPCRFSVLTFWKALFNLHHWHITLMMKCSNDSKSEPYTQKTFLHSSHFGCGLWGKHRSYQWYQLRSATFRSKRVKALLTGTALL